MSLRPGPGHGFLVHVTSGIERSNIPWFRYFRWLILATICGGAFVLVKWSRDYDPRFYHFLGTKPGQVLSRLMSWPTLHNLPATDKPEEELSTDELRVKRKLERAIEEAWPSHEVILRTGETLRGIVVSRDAEGIWFKEVFGRDGSAQMRIPMRRIRALRNNQMKPPAVTWRDIQFQMEYPEFQLVKRKHYTVLSDAEYYEIAGSVDELELLHAEFVEVFGDLIQYKERGRGIQVLFFSDESGYQIHQQKFAPNLADSSGFYSPLKDRMVVFNQLHSSRSMELRAQVDGQVQEMLAQTSDRRNRQRILALQEKTERQLRQHAKNETYATLRHEGAHHLSFTYGVLSSFHAENAWLVEGLAVYCETDRFGDVPVGHLSTLMTFESDGRWLSLRELVDSRSPEMLQVFEPGYHAYEAYAAAWSLVHYLMQPPNRDGFFEYIRFLRDPANLNLMVEHPRSEILAASLGVSVDALEAGWRRHVQRL